jgi:hypothetical protein
VPAKKYDADYWLARAEEARTIAAGMTVPAARLEMLKIAALYERLANVPSKLPVEAPRPRKGSAPPYDR